MVWWQRQNYPKMGRLVRNNVHLRINHWMKVLTVWEEWKGVLFFFIYMQYIQMYLAEIGTTSEKSYQIKFLNTVFTTTTRQLMKSCNHNSHNWFRLQSWREREGERDHQRYCDFSTQCSSWKLNTYCLMSLNFKPSWFLPFDLLIPWQT